MAANAQRVPWRERVADWWAGTWRWSLLAIGTVVAVYILLDRAGSGALITGIALALLVVGAVLTMSKPLAIALMAMPALFVASESRYGWRRCLSLGCRTRRSFRNRAAARPSALQPRAASNAVVQLGLPVRNAPHGDRQPLAEEHGRVVPCLAADLGRTRGRLGDRAGGLCEVGLHRHACRGVRARPRHGDLGASSSTLGGNFGPVYPQIPWAMHKNFVGTALAFVALIAYVHPPWAGPFDPLDAPGARGSCSSRSQ